MERLDLSNAPKGATHYFDESCAWVKFDGEHWFYFSPHSGKWMFCMDQDCAAGGAVPIEHGPQVGEIIETLDERLGDYWATVEVLARGKHGRHAALLLAELVDGQHSRMIGSVYEGNAGSFRKPTTEREAAIDEMVKACPYGVAPSARIDCEALYDAGYRKTEAAK